MPILENPAENPCFGCGPRHPRGLHLVIEREVNPDGQPEVRSRFTPQADEVGWPGLFHVGLHFFVLHEVSYWAGLTLGGHVMIFGGHAEFDQERIPRVGVEHLARAHVVSRDGPTLRIRATVSSPDGRLCGRLEGDWIPASRAKVERWHLTVPDYLLEEMDP
jgi:hypothetical protein